MKALKMAAILSATLFAAGAHADSDRITHPNLRDAFRECNQAVMHLRAAYRSNDNRGAFGGHVARAEKLLEEAKRQIRLSDEYRNAHTRREH